MTCCPPRGAEPFTEKLANRDLRRLRRRGLDPTTVAPGPIRRVRDFPADGERLTAPEPVGMAHTLVNGIPIRLDGEQIESDARPGRVLR